MPNTECPQTRRAELFVRADLPTPSQRCRRAIETRLQKLTSEGVFDETTTTSWAKRVPADSDDTCPERARYDEFVEWADDHGASLNPFFDTRLCYSTATGEKRTELVMPALCLAIYEDDELTQIAPCAGQHSTLSIGECLDDLEAGVSPSSTHTPTVTTAD